MLRLLLLLLTAAASHSNAEPLRPNVIFVLADDLGYGELGCYGQKVIQTPHLDRMAREGLRFTQFYAGATVCAPSRSVLMTGQHHGRTPVRGNAGKGNPQAQALPEGTLTVPRLLQQSGYATALVGKWGLGDEGPAATGLPRRQGFDTFFGFLNQTHAHNHYPDFLWRNETREPLPNVVTPVGEGLGGYATTAKVYADDLFADEVMKRFADPGEKPLFLFWSMVVPHANNERTRALGDGTEVPDLGIYKDKDWSAQDKGHAAMITRMDSYIGRLFETLRACPPGRETLVIFTSDNGPHHESGHKLERFQPSGTFNGTKRSLTDGGIRVPCIAWWSGKIAPGTETAQPAYFGDLMATVCELTGTTLPPWRDSISFLPILLGQPDKQARHEFLYWEFHEGGFLHAALYQGRWKGIIHDKTRAPFVLYDLQSDPAESRNVAADHPEIARRIQDYLDTARSYSSHWPVQR